MAIICVPTSTSASPAMKAAKMASWEPLRAVVSASQRRTRKDGKSRRKASSTFSVPAPKCRMRGLAQCGHMRAGISRWLQWWQTRRSTPWCQVRGSRQRGQPRASPQSRQKT